MTITTTSFDAVEDTNVRAADPAGGRPNRRPRRLIAGTILALTMLMGSLAVGAPAADALSTVPGITVTTCGDGSCALDEGELAILRYLAQNGGIRDGVWRHQVQGCVQVGNTCTMRVWRVTMSIDGSTTSSEARLIFFSQESCFDIGGLD